MSETNCARCSEEIEDTDVKKCPECEMDGICEACLAAHDCNEDSPQYACGDVSYVKTRAEQRLIAAALKRATFGPLDAWRRHTERLDRAARAVLRERQRGKEKSK